MPHCFLHVNIDLENRVGNNSERDAINTVVTIDIIALLGFSISILTVMKVIT